MKYVLLFLCVFFVIFLYRVNVELDEGFGFNYSYYKMHGGPLNNTQAAVLEMGRPKYL